jgi:hypothetical protein
MGLYNKKTRIYFELWMWPDPFTCMFQYVTENETSSFSTIHILNNIINQIPIIDQSVSNIKSKTNNK